VSQVSITDITLSNT